MRMTSLTNQLQKHFPEFLFVQGDDYSWSPDNQSIFYRDDDDQPQLLHELGHALLGHASYDFDINLLEMERDAWSKARQVGSEYAIRLSDETIQTALDSYREWLHARSTCPQCGSTGLQIDGEHYHCLACATLWRVNDARRCGLRRYIIKK